MISTETREYLEQRNLLGGPVETVEWSQAVGEMPTPWQEIARLTHPDERRSAVIGLWRSSVADQLSKTILYLERRLLSLDLIRVGGRLAVLYSVQGASADALKYYTAGMPVTDSDVASSKMTTDEWGRLPSALRSFYSHVHNGFRRYETRSQGIEAIGDAFRLSDLEWGIIEDEGLVPEIQLETSFAFFSSGAGAYLVLDLSQSSPETAAVLWAASSKPDYGLRFWDVLDEWIVIGFQR